MREGEHLKWERLSLSEEKEELMYFLLAHGASKDATM
jgi:hypothetical protein